MCKQILFLFLMLWVYTPVFTQSSSEVGILFGATDYLGDLSERFPGSEDLSWGVGFTGRYMVNRKFGVKGFVGYFNFTGSDQTVSGNRERGWETDFRLIETSLNLEYHPFGSARYNLIGHFNRFQLSPFVYVGLGATMGEAELALGELENEQAPRQRSQETFMIVPIGGGLRFDLARYAIVTLDVGMRGAFSDYLDGLSAGAEENNDWYAVGGLSVSFLIHGESARMVR